MNFKKLVVTTVLASAQVAMVIPAVNAQEVIHGTVIETRTPAADSTTDLGDVLSAAPETTSDPAAQSVSSDQQASGDQEQNGAKQPADATTAPNTGDSAQAGEPGSENGGAPANSSTTTDSSTLVDQGQSSGQLILMVNSNKMYQNGQTFTAAEPMAAKNGVSYVAIRSLVNRVGLNISYDSKTKETVIKRGGDELRFKLNSNTYKVNGVKKTMAGKSYSTKNNVFMVPLTSITKALDLPYKFDAKGKRVIVEVSTKPVAKFKVTPSEIVAGQTQVTYQTEYSSPTGQDIVQERWEGREDVFANPGTYVVAYSVMDASGQWSDPYSLTINVVKPHTPPVAAFTTDKDTYKMGELVTYTNQTTDEQGLDGITYTWENNKRAFFTPGTQTIRLTAKNKYGLTSTVEKTVTITNETLYTESEFNQLFTPVGEKYSFNGSQVPSWDKINYTFTTDPVTLIRSNSPETNYTEGILYRETTVGKARMMIHHLNATGKDMKLYVVATNPNTSPVNIFQETLGSAGPSNSPTAAGKISLLRYFTSMQTREMEKDITLAPGEQKIIFNDTAASSMKQGDTISLLSDYYTESPVQFDVIMIEAGRDPIKEFATLNIIPRDGIHNRGTYPDATRTVQYDELLGITPSRFILGDDSSDPFQHGVDAPYNTEERNLGNFGVLYKIRASRVAPHTLITFNPRGGTYTGYVMVNGKIVGLPNSGTLSNPSEGAVLYRTGDQEEMVDFIFTPSLGSNLAVNLLFQPLPETK
ncbi:DNA-directed RNA polymerase subunit beta [Paenibacillus sp. CAA11]|uniref:copper amine oxidase N-terminal domain-containing protein n=1 Tax=Paenibacillus sp. CAA11 TaxID=1532905 RepID=UPI000D3C4B74|nr:copper amine oxidase N-terminal domain-containing protein [Paenibacillus sp. CAA11]AWB45123.1 DNA-directed RNA polymerase subunit beta [Paenibacillus sp. CAA11]